MTAIPFDLDAVQAALGRDPEFLLQARYLTGRFRIVIGDLQSFQLTVTDGRVVEIDPLVTPFDAFDIQIIGTEEQWRELMAPTPRAFYQDFFPAMVHHGFRIEGDMEKTLAYYPAIRRMQDLLRRVANTEGVSL